ncbi:MAG TPA: beta-propeller fold lactonase family protein, partial [Planctomycetia bacterium]|nr:beta-propeller fold lactonase family protein [Planctomycetia bacterium]
MIRATPLLISSSLFLAATVVAQDAKAPPKSPRLLPGPQRDGAVQLPNHWSLRPTGRHVEVGDYPVQLVIHPSGKWLAILDAGNSDHEVVVVDVAKHEIVSRVTIDQAFYGIAFSPDGTRLFASGGEYATVHAFRFAEGFLSDKKTIPLVPVAERFVCGGLSVSADGKELFAAGTLGDSVVPVALGADVAEAPIKTGPDTYPYGILPVGDRLYVSLWGAASVAVIDRKTGAINARWKTESHPTEMALSPDGKTLYVACSNSTKVVSIDVANGTARETIACSLFPAAPSGNTPCSLALSPDGALLFVANADANNLALVNVSKPGAAVPLGFIPTGWYPTSVRFDAKSKRIFVANGKGLGSAPNPLGARPEFKRTLTTEQYIGRLMRGVVSAIPLPEPRQMAELSRTARRCSPLRADLAPSADAPANNPIPAKLGDPSPIKHCIYIIKENRTYDQVFGDDPRGNGDPNLCLFPEKVTPNHHKLVREFVLLDNFYCDGEVSADGHEWTMGAYATDYVEKVWPLT